MMGEGMSMRDDLKAGAELEVELDRLFEPWNRRDRPGYAVAVLDGVDLVAARCYGMANIEHGVAITPQTIFSIASISKQFSCAAAVRLAERGELDLDSSVRDHLPDLPEHCTPVTLRHAMSNTTGLRDFESLMVLAGIDFDRAYTADDVLALISAQRQSQDGAGDRYLYCNTGFRLLAHVLERVTGRSFPEILQTEVLAPSGMARSHMCVDRRAIEPDLASAYTLDDDGRVLRSWGLHQVFAVEQGAEAGLYSCLDDMVGWARNFVDDRLGHSVLRDMQVAPRLADGRPSMYGYGLNLTRHRGLPVVCHSGGMPGFLTTILHVPETGLGVVCLSNHDAVSASTMARGVVDIVLAYRLPAPPPLADLPGDIAGLYIDHDGGAFAVLDVCDGRLQVMLYDESHGLDPVGDGVHRSFDGWLEVQIADAPHEIGLWMGGRSARLKRVAPGAEAFTPPACAGRYVSAELGATYVVAESGGGVTLTIVGPRGTGPSLPLRFVGRDMFLVGAALMGWERDLATSLRFRGDKLLVSTRQAMDIVFERA
jgi:CubicO group peptidase (beta-lactamase class C family)